MFLRTRLDLLLLYFVEREGRKYITARPARRCQVQPQAKGQGETYAEESMDLDHPTILVNQGLVKLHTFGIEQLP